MFQASIIRCPVKLKVVEVARNVRDVVEERAKKMLEAVCSYVGYTKPGSLRLLQMGPGVLSGIDMGRHFTFQCTFAGEVCNPTPGTRIKAYVRSVNRFGALVEGGYIDHMGTLVPVIELVVIRDPTIAKNEVAISDLVPGDEVVVEVLGRRFELRDTRITGFGRTVLDPEPQDGVGASAAAAGLPETAAKGYGAEDPGEPRVTGRAVDPPAADGADGAEDPEEADGADGADEGEEADDHEEADEGDEGDDADDDRMSIAGRPMKPSSSVGNSVADRDDDLDSWAGDEEAVVPDDDAGDRFDPEDDADGLADPDMEGRV